MEENIAQRRRAQSLRRNATKEENHLWYDFLKTYPVQFKRQYQIGLYYADFYCYRAGIVIELDGSQHYELEGAEYDGRRTAFWKNKDCWYCGFPTMIFGNIFPAYAKL